MTLTPDELDRKIKEARARDEKPASSPGNVLGTDAGSARMAFRAAIELVSALVVGGVLGYGIDHWLGTKPWGMIIMFFLGFAAGFLNIYRAAMGQDLKIGLGNRDGKTKKD